MAIRAVLFDLGGVLENEIETGMDAKWEARLGLKSGELNARLFDSGLAIDATIGKVISSEDELYQCIGAVYGMNEEQVREFMKDIWEQYDLNVELAEFFQGLRPRYKTAILSNAWPDARREERERFHFEEMTDLIIYSYEEKTMKPERRIYEIACERLGVQPEEVVFLDNIEKAVEAARAFSIHAILFKDNAQAIADVRACLESA